MPVCDGLTAAKELRKFGYKGIIIGVTGNAFEDDRASFMKSGAHHVMAKPLDMTELVQILSKLLLSSN